MLEWSADAGFVQSVALGYGGDTFNVALYAARVGAQAEFVTALGDDPLSAQLQQAWADEGVRSEVHTMAGRLPGVYAIATQASGERSFYYWRSESAVRAWLSEDADVGALLRVIGRPKILQLSMITLAIAGVRGRAVILEALQQMRSQGCLIALDGNMRPVLWPRGLAEARSSFCEFVRHCDFVLPSVDDLRLLANDPAADTRALLDSLASATNAELLVSDGRHGCHARRGAESWTRHPAHPCSVLDTTAAGDAFSGAYLGARVLERSHSVAIEWATRAAAIVIGHRGAVVPRAAWSTAWRNASVS